MDKKEGNKVSRPFDAAWVRYNTSKNLKSYLDFSIRKTLDQIKKYDSDVEMSKQIFETLSALHDLRKTVEDFASVKSSLTK